MKNWTHQKDVRLPMEVKEDEGIFTGYASVYENVDLDGEIIKAGAFQESIARRGNTVTLLEGHDPTKAIGFARVSEDLKGLHVDEGRINLDNSRGRDVHSNLKFAREHQGVIYNGMSVGFNVGEDSVNSKGQREVEKLDLMEVSVVAFPANPSTGFSSLKSAANKLAIADSDCEYDEETSGGQLQDYFKKHHQARIKFEVFAPVLDVVHGELTIVPRAVYAIASKCFEDTRDREWLAEIYKCMGRSAPWAPRDLDDMKQHIEDLTTKQETGPDHRKALELEDAVHDADRNALLAALDKGWSFLGENNE